MSSTTSAVAKAASAIGTPCRCCGVIMGRSNHGAADGTNVTRHVSRGLCGSCYTACTRDGTLDEYPRIQRDRDEVLDQYAQLRREMGPHASLRSIATIMDLPRSSLSQYLARAGDDPRSDHYARSPQLVPQANDGVEQGGEIHGC